MYYHPSFWPEGFISLFINILVWGLIVYLFVFLVRKMSGGAHGGCCGMHESHDEAKNDTYYLDIVKERYAKGEIDKKQFEELKKDLSTDKSEK